MSKNEKCFSKPTFLKTLYFHFARGRFFHDFSFYIFLKKKEKRKKEKGKKKKVEK
jgi:hypothetical protein